MDVFILSGILTLAVPAAVIFLLVALARMHRRVKELERQMTAGTERITDLERRFSAGTAPGGRPAAQQGPWQRPAAETAPPEAPIATDAPQTAPEDAHLREGPSQDGPAQDVQSPDGPPRAVVFRTDRMVALGRWLAQNWFYAVSAVSLALAGIFLVQYGIETGLLPPPLRVLMAMIFGAALVVAGETIRRRFGDDEQSATAYLPSTFSGAGIVTLFGAVLSARVLYGLIGPEIALAGMVLVGAGALLLGWLYGPLLAAIGLIGATVAPFVVGGKTADPSWLFGYFAVIALVGLAIDTMRRWAWVSVLTLGLGFGAGTVLWIGSGPVTDLPFVVFCAGLMLAAIAIPVRSLVPDHAGTMLSVALWARRRGDPWPEFPTRLAGAATVAASALIALVLLDNGNAPVYWVTTGILATLVFGLLVWGRTAPALTDQIAVPMLALLVAVPAGDFVWRAQATLAAEPEAALPMAPSVLVLIGLVLSAVTAWRSLQGDTARAFLAVLAALMAPALAILIEVIWAPAYMLGAPVWAFHAAAIAMTMILMAERFARADGPQDRLRMSVAVLSALASIAFAFVIVFSSVALTTALAVTIVAAAALDRRYGLPLMTVYILVGISTVMYRLVIDPGLDWATFAPIPAVLLSHGGAVCAFGAAWWLIRDRGDRPRAEVLLDSAIFSGTGVLASVLTLRIIEDIAGGDAVLSHGTMGVWATIWLALSIGQLRRLRLGGPLAILRKVLATVFALIGMVPLLVALGPLNPVEDSMLLNRVHGLPVLNTMIPAYLMPAAVLGFGARWLTGLPRFLRVCMFGLSGVVAVIWAALTIRHFWQGAEGMPLPGVLPAELYSYTVALLAAGAALFYLSLARRDLRLRRAGLLVIGLAVAKVFLIDIADLGGLIRVFSLLALGFSLAGLAWLNRWAGARVPTEPAPTEPAPDPSPDQKPDAEPDPGKRPDGP